jgi:primosomal protein N'
MALVECPQCGESKRLKGHRTDDGIHVACQACGHEWIRTPDKCPTCGEPMLAFRAPLLHKARGTQQSILAYRVQKRCVSCEGPPPPPDTSATVARDSPRRGASIG